MSSGISSSLSMPQNQEKKQILRVQFSKYFQGEHAPGPPYVIRPFRADIPLVSPVTLVLKVHTSCSVTKVQFHMHLMFSYKKKISYLDKMNDCTKSGWKQELEHKWNYTKRDYVAAEKIVKSIGDHQKSSWIMNLEENFVRIMNHWGKNDRNHEYQDSNDSASSPDCLQNTRKNSIV